MSDGSTEDRSIDPDVLQRAIDEFGLHDGYTHADIMAAYHKLARRYHPDLAKNEYDRNARKLAMKRVNGECQTLLMSLASPVTDDSDTAYAAADDASDYAANVSHAGDNDANGSQAYQTPRRQPGNVVRDAEASDANAQTAGDGATEGRTGFIGWLHMVARTLIDGSFDSTMFANVAIVLEIIGFVMGLVLIVSGTNGELGGFLITLSIINLVTFAVGMLLALKLLGYVLSFITTVLDGISYVLGCARKSCED